MIKTMKQGLAAVVATLAVGSAAAQSTLSPGDLAIVEVAQNSGEVVHLVALVNFDAGTTFSMTDNGYTSSGALRDNEGIVTYTASSAVAAGDIITYDSTTVGTDEWVVTDATFAITNSGDSILVFQGDAASPSFVFGLTYANDWDPAYTTADGTCCSALPAELTAGTTAVFLPASSKNGVYNGTLSDTKAALQADISDSEEWTQSGTEIVGTRFPGSTFTVTDAADATPAPSSAPTASAAPTPATPAPTALDTNIRAVRDAVAAGTTGVDVVVEGVVVNDRRSSTRNGFYMQMTKADADADTSSSSSEGAFVYCGSGCNAGTVFAEGDLISIEATTAAYSSRPQLTQYTISTETVTVLSSDHTVTVNSALGAALAAEVNVPVITLPATDMSTDFVDMEDMLVSILHDMTVGDLYDLKYGTIGISQGGRIFAETMEVEPGAAAEAQEDLNARRVLALDDGSSTTCPVPQAWPVGGSSSIRAGTVIPESALEATAIIHYEFGVNTLIPTESGLDLMKSTWDKSEVARVGDIDPLVPANDLESGLIRISGLNVENYFTELGCSSCRGADNEEEFSRQRTKIFTSAIELDAAVFGLQEVQNDDDVTLANFVDGLNTQAGVDGKWSYIATGIVGGDAIKCAIIYQSALVTPVGNFSTLVYTNPVDKSRPSVAQTFTLVGSNDPFTLVVNHLKSKGSACEEDAGDGTSDQLYGEGNCGYARQKHAQQLISWLNGTNPTGVDTDKYILLGDFNSHVNDRSLQEFVKDGAFVSLADRDIDEPYSYVYDGKFSTLDYFLVTPSLSGSCGNTYEWHINSPETLLIDYQDEQYSYPSACETKPPTYFDISTPYRGSDHDPIVATCTFEAPERTTPSPASRGAVALGTTLLALVAAAVFA